MTIENGHTVSVLDHGYVKYVDSMGEDSTIVEAARMSTGRGFISWEHYARCKSMWLCLGDERYGKSAGSQRTPTPATGCEGPARSTNKRRVRELLPWVTWAFSTPWRHKRRHSVRDVRARSGDPGTHHGVP
jgi:hypothetical protein